MTAAADHRIPYFLFQTRGVGAARTREITRTLHEHGRRLSDLAVGEISPLLSQFPRWGPEAARSFSSLDLVKLDQELSSLNERGVGLVSVDDAAYPKRLTERLNNKAPTLLFLRGNCHLVAERGVAIVGSRAASPEALAIAGALARDLAANGFNVISGYADGIDTAAHRGALEGDGTTTIVLSQGILGFKVKPSLRDVIRSGNTLAFSQFAPREPWSGRNAMVRNAVVCALSEAVIVIESGAHVPGKMSGTFDAGETALRLNVPLFVVDPTLLPNVPAGNAELVRLGARACHPHQMVQHILEHRAVRCTPVQGEQLTLSL